MTTFGDYTLPRLRVRLVTIGCLMLRPSSVRGTASPRTGRVILLAGAGRGRRAPGRGVHPTPHSCTIYRTSTPTVANHGAARRGATSPVPLPERRFVTGRASRATPYRPPFLHRSDHQCPGLAGLRWRRGAGGVGGRAHDGASARPWRAPRRAGPAGAVPSPASPASPATVRRVRCGFLLCHGGSPVRVPYRNRHGADRSALGFRR